jgi:hypothetical protein
MKNVCFVYIFKHMIMVDLNSEIGIKICVINNTDKLKCILVSASHEMSPERIAFSKLQALSYGHDISILEHMGVLRVRPGLIS